MSARYSAGMHKTLAALVFVFALGAGTGFAQAPATAAAAARKTGPVIKDYGAVFEVPSPDFPTPKDTTLKAMFIVGTGPESPTAVNDGVNAAARFLNMHAN